MEESIIWKIHDARYYFFCFVLTEGWKAFLVLAGLDPSLPGSIFPVLYETFKHSTGKAVTA